MHSEARGHRTSILHGGNKPRHLVGAAVSALGLGGRGARPEEMEKKALQMERTM